MQSTNFTPVTLEYSQDNYYDFLSDFINDESNLRIKKLPFVDEIIQPIEVSYSLSYSQGDGCSLTSGKFTIKEDSEVFNDIKKYINKYYDQDTLLTAEVSFAHDSSSHYYHENSFTTYLYIEYGDDDKGYNQETIEWEDIYPKQSRTHMEYNIFQDICLDLEKMGYDYIEEEDKEQSYRDAFDLFLTENNIETDLCFYDFSQSNEPIEGYTLVATSGSTSYQPLYMLLPNPKKETRTTTETFYTL